MRYRRSGGGLLGLLVVAVLGALAFAGSAQALTPKFNVNGSTTLEANIGGVQEGTATLLVPASNLSIKCSESKIQEGLILKDGAIIHARFLFGICISFEHKGASELPCHVSDVAAGKPEILDITIDLLMYPVEIISGIFGILAGKISSQVNFLSGTGCPLPLKNVVKGEICFKITSGNDTTEPLIQSNQTIQGECPEVKLEGTEELRKDKLLFGANEAFLVGAMKLFGSGAHAGKTLGVLLL